MHPTRSKAVDSVKGLSWASRDNDLNTHGMMKAASEYELTIAGFS